MDNVTYYIAALLMIIIGFLVIKKVAGCLVRTIVTLILVAVLVALYYFYFRT